MTTRSYDKEMGTLWEDRPENKLRDNRDLMRKRPREVCRVCGSQDVHSREYGKPTMDCVNYLKAQNGQR